MYNEWLEFIHHSNDPLYYDHLLKHSDHILDTHLSSKDMAQALQLNAQQYAVVKKLLIAYRRGKHAE